MFSLTLVYHIKLVASLLMQKIAAAAEAAAAATATATITTRTKILLLLSSS